MSLNKTLDRLFDEIRREAKRNPDFANRLDAVMRTHGSRRDVPDDVTKEIAAAAEPAAAAAKPQAPAKPKADAEPPAAAEKPGLNPVGVYQRDGAEALAGVLEGLGLPALQALVSEHNLDPSGETADLDRDALVAHVLVQAKRRTERDEKLFDY